MLGTNVLSIVLFLYRNLKKKSNKVRTLLCDSVMKINNSMHLYLMNDLFGNERNRTNQAGDHVTRQVQLSYQILD